jgi:hypothetical protein
MNEYGVRPHENGLSEEGVQHVQLAYAPYSLRSKSLAYSGVDVWNAQVGHNTRH